MGIKLLCMLFLQFFHTGLFAFGGGYSTIPFLYDISDKFHWYTTAQLTHMLAVSSITPGPVGVNMATFAGFTTAGIKGAFIATFAVILPSFIIVSVVYNVLDKFKNNLYIKNIIKTLKPAGCALLTAVGARLVFTSGLHLIGILILTALLISGFKKKQEPIFYLGLCAVLGFILGHLHFIGV